MNLIPNFDIGKEKLNDFYKGVINGKLLGEKKRTLENYKGRKIECTKDFNGISSVKLTGRIILTDKVFYIFEIWDLTGDGQSKLKKKFFKSIDVK
jgi:hypothetical protein